jgi:hypothetical protein
MQQGATIQYYRKNGAFLPVPYAASICDACTSITAIWEFLLHLRGDYSVPAVSYIKLMCHKNFIGRN